MSVAVLLTPWYRRSRRDPVDLEEDEPGSTAPTAILDLDADPVRVLVARSRQEAGAADPRAVLAAAHSIISREVSPVYALEETLPVSRVLDRGTGSCSQRLAVLEGVARSIGVPTRVRALLVHRSFWYPRFPRLAPFLPDTVVLLWPEFALTGGWQPASELFGPVGCRGGRPFRNAGAETLFEAAGRCAVDWDGTTGSAFDLSRFVVSDRGRFADRDTAIRTLGQTLCTPSRRLIDPVLRRVAA